MADKLREDRVRRVVEPLLRRGGRRGPSPDRDLEYIRDLGLLARDRPVRIANPIYAEVVPRELTWVVQEGVRPGDGVVRRRRRRAEHARAAGGVPDVLPGALGALVEAVPVPGGVAAVAASRRFLQRVVNSGGRIEREYGLGRGHARTC